MKKMKKFVSVLVAATMTMAMAAPSFADPTDPTDPTVETTAAFSNDPTTPIRPAEAQTNLTLTIADSIEGRTYVAYQIFTGDLALDANGEKVLSNIQWGSDVGDNMKKTPASAKAETLTSASEAAQFAKELNNGNLKGDGTTISWSATNKSYSLTGLKAGYYLVKQTGTASADEEGFSAYILEMVGDTTTHPKQNSTPTFEKNIDVANGAEAPTSYTVGDVIPYILTATIPDDIDQYTTYPLTFIDTFDEKKALTYNGGAVVTIGETLIAKDDNDPSNEDKGVTFSNNSDETVHGDTTTASKLVINISDVLLLDKIKVTPGMTVTVKYSATVNSNAEAGTSDPITNQAKLTFRNNANVDADRGSKDRVIDVYTFGFELTKQDAKNDTVKLSGAEFKITRTNGTATEVATIANGKITGWVALQGDAANPENGTAFASGTDGKVAIEGLGAGTYQLVETKAPVGYNKLAVPQELVINPLTMAEGNLNDISYTFAEVQGTANVGEGMLSLIVKNNSGTVLPSTGGIGTTIFYAVGIILMAGAVFFVVRKKRA